MNEASRQQYELSNIRRHAKIKKLTGPNVVRTRDLEILEMDVNCNLSLYH